VKNVLKQIKEISKKFDIVSGFHVIPPDAREVFKKIQDGYKFIGFSLDTLFLGHKCREEMGKLKTKSF
jgi:2-dehydro-3-deoxyglucarate aldolase